MTLTTHGWIKGAECLLQVEGFIQGTFDLVKNLPEEFAELPGDVSTSCPLIFQCCPYADTLTFCCPAMHPTHAHHKLLR